MSSSDKPNEFIPESRTTNALLWLIAFITGISAAYQLAKQLAENELRWATYGCVSLISLIAIIKGKNRYSRPWRTLYWLLLVIPLAMLLTETAVAIFWTTSPLEEGPHFTSTAEHKVRSPTERYDASKARDWFNPVPIQLISTLKLDDGRPTSEVELSRLSLFVNKKPKYDYALIVDAYLDVKRLGEPAPYELAVDAPLGMAERYEFFFQIDGARDGLYEYAVLVDTKGEVFPRNQNRSVTIDKSPPVQLDFIPAFARPGRYSIRPVVRVSTNNMRARDVPLLDGPVEFIVLDPGRDVKWVKYEVVKKEVAKEDGTVISVQEVVPVYMSLKHRYPGPAGAVNGKEVGIGPPGAGKAAPKAVPGTVISGTTTPKK